MQLLCDTTLAANYKSAAQIARVISESWLEKNGYCIACTADRLIRSAANTRCTDFVCDNCDEKYELKTFLRRPRTSIVDGAYSALMSRVMNGSAPTLFLLERDKGWNVSSLTAIHSVFLTPSVIEKRRPLGPNAVRAGWVGCNIRLDKIGPDGEVPLIAHGKVITRKEARDHFRKFLPLSRLRPMDRGWTTLTLTVIRGLAMRTFNLLDLYRQESLFQSCYPANKNVRPKIRQQLQVLRDLKLITFDGRGKYTLIA